MQQKSSQRYNLSILSIYKNKDSPDRNSQPWNADRAKLAVKDAYTFDFLELADEHSERELEKAILTRVDFKEM